MDKTKECIKAYSELQNLKLVGERLEIPWQTVYCLLKNAGVPVVGNKSKYGSDTDKFASKAEEHFSYLFPNAKNNNQLQWQSKCDFSLGKLNLDIKASNLKRYLSYSTAERWAFSVKAQNSFVDFVVGFAYKNKEVERIYLFPSEIINGMQTISISYRGSKWDDFLIDEQDLVQFLNEVSL